ncbi:MAG TPA: sialidase family protein, partial [Ktedonobacteraceae bacterium]|nr:sialidase family protein [Ktedonobacteraceae bacterium]
MPYHNPFPQGTTVLAVGTKRGLFLLSSQDRVTWNVEPASLKGRRIFHAILDQRSGQRLFAAENGDFFGSFIRYSDDFGQSWQEPEHGIQFPQNGQLTLKNIWVIEPGRPTEAGMIYAGVDPASLWVSTDNGSSWEPDASLLAHPTRERWEPGAGGLCLHT